MMNATADDWSGMQPSLFSNESGNFSDLDYDNTSNLENAAEDSMPALNIPYVVFEILVAVTAVIGNALTIVVFVIDRKLRRLTNYYIVSLATADLLVGMPGIPFAILTSIGIPENPYMCLPMLSLLIILCTVSIFSLVAVSVDRYWAILYPLRYSRVMTAKIARRIITLCWIAGTCLGLLPMMGWRMSYVGGCVFTEVMNYDYLVFIYFSTIVGPGVLMALFYTHIYTVVLKQTKLSVKSEHGTLRQIAAQEPQSEAGSVNTQQGGSQKRPHFLKTRRQSRSQGEINKCDSRRYSTSTNIVHQVTHASRREVKAAKSLSIIVLFFFVCWFPLYTINCVQAFCGNCSVSGYVMYLTIILTHVNSAVNPFLYAYHMKDFRLALKTFILQRILRRQMRSDPIYGSRLVSPHHSTFYRVPVGGGSPQLANLHTPHAHNTPITSSPSPVGGTPGGLRSRSSTLGSYGPWLPSRGVSPNASLVKTPEGQDEPLARPRAATINTHTSPASVHPPRNEIDHLKKPQLSATNLLVLADDSQSTFKDNETSSLSPDAVTLNIDNMDPTDAMISIDNEGHGTSDAANSGNHHHVIPLASIMNRSKSETLLTSEYSAASSYVPHNTSVPLLIYSSLKRTDKHNSSCPDSSTLDANSGIDEYHHTDLQSIPCETEMNHNGGRTTPSSISENQKLLSSHICCSDRDRCDCKISTSGIEEDFSKEKESEGQMKHDYLLLQENNRNGTDNSLKTSNGKKKAASETFTTTQIPNGTDEITSGSADASKSVLNCDAFDSKRKGTETLCVEATSNQCRTHESGDESSHVTQEFYKYLPKILRRKEESKKSKSSRTGKGWFSSMMRNRSYHGLSLEVTSSKQLPRAQSISGTMET